MCTQFPEGLVTAGSDSVGLQWGLRICISNQLLGNWMLLVHGSQIEEHWCTTQASVLLISSPSDSDAPKFSEKIINWLWGQTDLGYNAGPHTFSL